MPITLISIMIINIISNIIREAVKVQDGRKCRTLKWHNELCGRESTVPVLDQRGGVQAAYVGTVKVAVFKRGRNEKRCKLGSLGSRT